MIYDLLAPIYDKINEELDYCAWADFIEDVMRREYVDGTPELVLDLGCGTGRMTLELARRGYDMTGIDISPEMLDFARREAESLPYGAGILWLCQDMRSFELYGTVDVAVSCLDSINHLTSTNDLAKCFSLVHNYLIPDGLFIFDVNGRYKFENIYGTTTYAMEEGNAVCIWQNYYNQSSHLCDFYITLFNEGEDGRYTRYDDEQRERMYTIRTLKSQLVSQGFEFIGAYSDFEFTPADDSDERIYIVARCKKNKD